MLSVIRNSLILFITVSVIGGCISDKTNKKDEIITVSILPQKYFVDRITGGTIEVNIMVPPGANHATYEPTVKQMKLLGISSIYLRIGYIEFEKVWMNRIAANNKNLKIVDTSKEIEIIETEYVDHGDHSHGGVDPHIWMSPKKVKIMAKNIYNALSEMYPDEREYYHNNYIKFIEDVNELDLKTYRSLANLENRKFLIFHPALTYFASDYALEQIPVQLEGKDPGTAYFRKIINYATENSVRIVFIQKQFDTENARVIAEEINGKVVQINPLEYNWPEQIEHITQSLLKFNKKQ